MKPFLEAVAQDIYKRFGENLSRTAVIFPGKRAGLWFNRYLYECAEHPLWAPAYLTIDELFGQLSPLEINPPIRTICLLHKIFCHHTQRAEPLDDFYYWGELMLADFDDIDKNMIEGEKLFMNLANIKDIDNQFDYLTTEQKEILNRFFTGLKNDAQQTELKARFIELWQVMGSIYKELKDSLLTQGLAYEGMLYRDAIEQFDTTQLTYDHYVIIGFNVLNRVEQQLFDRLKESGKAYFYWDYDHYYYDNPLHEAGTFVRENIVRYGNMLADDASLYNNFHRLTGITYISASTDNAQARYLNRWINEHLTEEEQDTAVVLCDEDIIYPVLHSLPNSKIRNVNITMGFKLTQTPVYTLTNAYLELQTKGYDETQGMYMLESATTLLSHPYIVSLHPNATELREKLLLSKRIYIKDELDECKEATLKVLFKRPSNDQELLTTLDTLICQTSRLFANQKDENSHFAQLNEEALFRIHRMIENFKVLIEEGIINIQTKTLVRLMQRVMAQTSIPFHGEPAIGLQVMGVLETRNIDFRNIILLSTNEGKLPKSMNEASFIPYNLREAFGMTTIERKNAVYAYYFYRMIQRAEHVTIVYNNGTDGLNKQEPSRYLMQLQVEFPGELTALNLHSPSRPKKYEEITIKQTAETRRKLQEHFRYSPEKHDRDSNSPNYRLSPSALNDYLDCRLRFYLKHIEGLTPPENANADVDMAALGNIFHKSAELAYSKLTERDPIITKMSLETLIKDNYRIESFVDEAFRTEFFHTDTNTPLKFNGTQLIVRYVICSYLHQLLRLDTKRVPFKYIQGEKQIRESYPVESHGTRFLIQLGGTIDRIDSKTNNNGQEVTRIIDYKTGGSQKSITKIDELFHRDKPRDGYVFQAFYYAYLMNGKYDCIAPALLFVRNTADSSFEPCITIDKHPVEDFNIYYKQFGALLHETIDEIFNSDVPYTAATYKEACKYCKFTSLCRRTYDSF